MIFVDGIAITSRYPTGSIPTIAGSRRIAYRLPGDVDQKGKIVVEDEIVGESFSSAWIQGSHSTKLQLRSDGETVTLMGNPGRFSRPDNLFNLDLAGTVAAANRVAASQGFPLHCFHPGELDLALSFTADSTGKVRGRLFTGSRVWSIHLTQNYATGSAANARGVMNWAGTQSVARVKKRRLGASTMVWGSLKYCQTELYDKAQEMLDHCKNAKERDEMRQTEAYKYAERNGIIRLEVKCAKDFLRERQLTYLGAWDMGTVHKIFNEKAEILERCKVEVDAYGLATMAPRLRLHYSAWMSGIDLAAVLPRSTFFRIAARMRDHGVDITEPRDVTVMRPTMEQVSISPASLPEWYSLNAA